MRRVLAIIDADIRFALKLSAFINDTNKVPIKALAYRSYTMFENDQSAQEVVLFVCDEENLGCLLDKGVPICLLTEDGLLKDIFTTRKEQVFSIFRYSMASVIVEEILEAYTKGGSGLTKLSNKHTQITGIYSPIHRCGKTRLGLSLAAMAKEEKKDHVLFVSFDEWRGEICGGSQDIQMDLSDALYSYRGGHFNWEKLSRCVKLLGYAEMILPARYGEDIYSLSPEEVADFITVLAQQSVYTHIIIDFGSLGKRAIESLLLCQSIYMPIVSENVGCSKVEEFFRFCVSRGHADLEERIMRIDMERLSIFKNGNFDMAQEIARGLFRTIRKEIDI